MKKLMENFVSENAVSLLRNNNSNAKIRRMESDQCRLQFIYENVIAVEYTLFKIYSNIYHSASLWNETQNYIYTLPTTKI